MSLDPLPRSVRERPGDVGLAPRAPAPAAAMSLYAGFFVVDTRLALFVLGVSALISLGVLAIFVKNRRFLDYFALGVSLFVGLTIALSTIFALLLNRAPLIIESFFPLP